MIIRQKKKKTWQQRITTTKQQQSWIMIFSILFSILFNASEESAFRSSCIYKNKVTKKIIRSYFKLLRHAKFIRKVFLSLSADDDSCLPEVLLSEGGSVTFDLMKLLFSSWRRTGLDEQSHGAPRAACRGSTEQLLTHWITVQTLLTWAVIETNHCRQTPSLLIKHMQMRCLSRLTWGIVHDLWKCCAQGHFYVKSNSNFSLCQGE